MLRNAYCDLFKLMGLIDRMLRCAEMRDRNISITRQPANTYTFVSTGYGLLMPLLYVHCHIEQADIHPKLRTPQSNYIVQGDT